MITALRKIRALLALYRRKHGDLVGCLIVFLIALGAYIATLAPTVAAVFDDSLEFQLVAFQPGIAHPTGYPLYTLLGKLFTFLPVGDVAYRVNLMSAVFGAFTAPALFMVCRQLDCRRLPAMAAALVFAFSPVFWSQAVVAEVYTLNALFVAATLCLVLLTANSQSRQAAALPLTAAAFVFGLSLTHHRTMLLLAPSAAAFLWMQRDRLPALSVRRLARLLLAFAAPLLLYLYLPIRGATATSLDGSYVNTVQGFLGWVTASGYGSFFADNPLARDTASPAFVIKLFVDQFGYGGLALSLAGLLFLLVTSLPRFVLVGGALACYGIFAFGYRVSDVQVFYIPAFLLVSAGIGCGITGIWRWMDLDATEDTARLTARESSPGLASKTAAIARSGLRWTVAGACIVAALVLPIEALLRTMPQQDMTRNRIAYEYGMEILRQPLEDRAAVVGILGETTLLRYFQETEGLRTDLRLIAADRDEERIPAIARTLASGTPVYLTRPLSGVERAYSLSSFGPLIRVRRAPLMEPPFISSPRLLDFSGQAMLLGYSINETPVPEPAPGLVPNLPRPGSNRPDLEPTAAEAVLEGVEAGKRLGVTLYWRAPVTLTEDYKVSLRVVDVTGRLVAQHDSMPINDAYPTSSWRPGEIVIDTHYLHVPLGTAPGAYELRLALYSARTPDGLKAFDGAKLENIAGLGMVRVNRPDVPPVMDGLPVRAVQQVDHPALPGWTESDSLASLGIATVLRGNFDNQISLYGYGLSRSPLIPGEGVEAHLMWQADRDIESDYVAFLQVVDGAGKIWASSDRQPVGGAYPTSRWRRGEVIRDTHTLLLPANMPNGEFQLQAGLYHAITGERLTLLRMTRRSTDALALGSVTVKGRDRALTAPKVAAPQQARFGSGIQMNGYDLSRSGSRVDLVLHFQAIGYMDRSYTVFAHLLDANSRIWAQRDSMPLAGAAPTTSWLPGEYVSDRYALTISPDAPPGRYVLEIGFYDATSNQRLPAFDEQGTSVGDRILLKDAVTLP